MSRIAAGGAFVRADRDRGVAASLAPPSGGDAESVAAWEAAVDRARIAVEEQGVAAINLELFQRFGVDAWKGHVEELDALQVRASFGCHCVCVIELAGLFSSFKRVPSVVRGGEMRMRVAAAAAHYGMCRVLSLFPALLL